MNDRERLEAEAATMEQAADQKLMLRLDDLIERYKRVADKALEAGQYEQAAAAIGSASGLIATQHHLEATRAAEKRARSRDDHEDRVDPEIEDDGSDDGIDLDL